MGLTVQSEIISNNLFYNNKSIIITDYSNTAAFCWNKTTQRMQKMNQNNMVLSHFLNFKH